MKLEQKLRLRILAVWICRALVGATFIISGWAKSIDPWGFTIKVREYLITWGASVPHEAIVATCIALACIEFFVGAMVLCGSLKRSSAIVAATIMAVMLPLTVYIAIAEPVADCGCFGDFWHISNTATLLKNILLTVAVIYLLLQNRHVSGLFPAPIQWLTVVASLAFPLFLALEGYNMQPLVDFRAYPVGSQIFVGENINSEDEKFVYEKNGKKQIFALSELPDSSWTYVERVESNDDNSDFGGPFDVRDKEGNNVVDDIVTEDEQLFLILPNPDMHYLIYAHYVNRMSRWADAHHVGFCAVVGEGDKDIDRWLDWCRPDFAVYYADPIALSQLVRGREAMVYTDGGEIIWKRTLSSMPERLPDGDDDAVATLEAPDNGRRHKTAVMAYLTAMAAIYLLSLSPRALRFFSKLFFIAMSWRKRLEKKD